MKEFVYELLYSEPSGAQTGSSTLYPFEQRGRGLVIDTATESLDDY
jgi:hypothetical protein